jgi:hypothetical protein
MNLTKEEALADLNECNRAFYLEHKMQDLQPMFFLFRSSETIPVLCPFDDDRSKDLAISVLRRKVRELGDVYMYAFISEGWALRLPPGSDPSKSVRPSKSDQRIELVTTMVVHRDGTRLSDMHELIRDWKTGHVIELKALDRTDQMETRFELFPTQEKED